MVKFESGTKEKLQPANVKLVIMKHTGDEILSYLLQNDEEDVYDPIHYYLFNPVKLVNVVDGETGMMRYVMAEWISNRLSNDGGFEVKASDILVVADVDSKIKETYIAFCKRVDFLNYMEDNEEKMNNLGDNNESYGFTDSSNDDDENNPVMIDDEDELNEAVENFFKGTLKKPTKKTLH